MLALAALRAVGDVVGTEEPVAPTGTLDGTVFVATDILGEG